MGNSQETQKIMPIPSGLCRSDFIFHQIIGQGGFGRVWEVTLKKGKKLFAMKEMNKARVYSKKSVSSVLNERKLLSILKHPFIVNMQYAFQDRENLYLVMDLMSGGDLRFHLCRINKFTEEQARFFIACIVTGLEYLHVNGILHKDIKPENLVFDNKGYLRITDFGIAKILEPENRRDSSGTPGYMAPEVMNRQNHGIGVDYYALGIIAYELMTGTRPYIGRNRNEIKEKIIASQVQLKKTDVPKGWSIEAADFINKLIQRKPEQRLGFNGPQEVKNHAWLRDFPWKKLLEKKLEAPFVPRLTHNFHPIQDKGWAKDFDPAIRDEIIQPLFVGYIFDPQIANFKKDEMTQRADLNSTARVKVSV